MDIGTYILDENGNPVREEDTLKWGRWFETGDKKIASSAKGDIRVSTVFLGVDHSYGLGGPPLLFETMIFGGEHDQFQDRCETKKEALAMHENAVKMVGIEP